MKQEKFKRYTKMMKKSPACCVLLLCINNNLNKTETDNNLKATRRSRFFNKFQRQEVNCRLHLRIIAIIKL